jgi:hypothetical protein
MAQGWLESVPGHMKLTLLEMARAVEYRNINPTCIEIASRPLQGDYIKATGEYVGSGMKVFILEIQGELSSYTHTVRATNRKDLRKYLKLFYPACKIER